jgi:threonine dehydratase
MNSRATANPPVPSPNDVTEAAEVISGIAVRTPVVCSERLNLALGVKAFVKVETLQRSGSFKFRGAYSHISRLPTAALGRGLITYSSGNHANAVALIASNLRCSATILLPEDCATGKVRRLARYPVAILRYRREDENREELAQRIADERGLSIVPPSNDPLVVAGQGTVALELLEEIQDLDALVVPVGGGGLIAGTCLAMARGKRTVRVLGVEPEQGADTHLSLQAGRRVGIPTPQTLADGMRHTIPDPLPFQVMCEYVSDVILVSDSQILSAMALLYDSTGIVAEPSGACAIAGLLAAKESLRGMRLGVVASGGNIDSKDFRTLLVRGRHARAVDDPRASKS